MLDIGPGCKGLVVTCDDDAADTIIGFKAIERLPHLFDQLRIKRIERIGPIEPDDANAVLALDNDRFVRHRELLLVRTSAARLTLADRTVKGRATGLGHAPHGAPAARLGAWLAVA